MPDSTIKPPVQVTARDSAGNTVTTFNGTIHLAIATDGSPRKNAKLHGDTVATAVAGVATFSSLSIDTVGTGYTLSAALATGGPMGTSAPFDVAASPPPPPTTGDLTVGNTTTGSDLDPDGYTVTVDGGQSQPLAVNATTTYTGLSVANHTVQIAGVASNCTVGGANPRTVSVPAGATAQTTFSITCAPLPPSTGDLRVTTSTTGSNLDPDGYTVTVDGTASQAITINNSTGVTFTGLNAGSHSVALSGVAANCTVSGGATQTVTITANQTATLAFSVTCAATTGSLSVTTSTSGSNLDPDGYTVALDGGAGQPIGINASFAFNGVAAGSHTVTLSGVAGNCTVSGGSSQTTTVTGGQTANVTFSVTCAATTGSLTVTTATSGSNQPSGYTVTVDGSQSKSIAASGTVSYSGLTAASHTVQLNGVPSNCTVSEANPQTVNVPANGTGQAAFTITCNPLTGNLSVTTTTSGSNLPSGYTVTVDGGQSKTIGASGSVTYSGLSATTHSVQLSGVPSNCTVSEANPQTVSVPPNGTGQATFTITCAPPPNQPPVVDAGPDANLLVGALYTETASFTDPDHNGPWSWTIDWGDGSSSSGTASSEGSFSATHTYLLPNSYRVTVTVTDAAGGVGSGQKTLSVTL
jgi:PKD domain